MSLLEQVLAAGPASVDVEVAAGVLVRVRSLTIGEFEKLAEIDESPTASATILLYTCLDPSTGEPLFDSLDQVRRLPLTVSEDLLLVANRLSRRDEQAVEAAGKGSSTTPGTASSTTSPTASG